MEKVLKSLKTLFIWIGIFLIALVLLGYLGKINGKEKTYTELISGINKEEIKNVEISYDKKFASYKEENNIIKVNLPSLDNFMKDVSSKVSENKLNVKQLQIPREIEFANSVLPLLPYALITIVLILWLTITLKRNGQGGIQGGSIGKEITFGKSKARLIDNDEENVVKFKDVAGIEEEKEELKEIVDFLKNPQKYIDMGARIPKGVLLVGRPGTGKTLLAKAVAGEAGVPFYIISGSDFVEMYVGVGAKRVREMFQEAKKNSPCIIFIDEIDAVGRQRGAGLGGGHDEREQTLNQLLVEMDGFGKNEGVIVLAATNRPDVLDSALLRPGRFDRQIVVSMPDAKAREQILKVHASNKKFAEDVDLKIVAKNTPGFVGADLENLLNEAALLAARQDHTAIEQKDIEDAMVKVTMGPEKRTRVRSDKEKRLVAYHEAGHAVVSKFLPTQDPVHEISIIPRGMAGGYTMYRPSEDKSFISKTEMEEQIISLLGGRVAEEIVIKDISTGASNDIERATAIAKSMITKYGMNERLGTVTYGSESQEVFLGRDLAQEKTYSEETAAIIDEEINKMISKSYQRAKELLEQNMDKLDAVATVLIEKEKITEEEFNQVFDQN